MICVFEPLATAFDGNGKAALMPTGGSIRQVAAGDYSFTMEHPLDPWGKWKELKREAIVKLPVPEEVIPNSYSGIEADVYKTTAEAPMYESASAPTTISYPAWPNATTNPISVGAKTSYSGKNYECIYWDPSSRGASATPAEALGTWWKEIARSTPGAPVLVTLKAGTELYLVEDVDATWLKLCTKYGLTGYVQKSKATYDHHASASENQPRTIKEQLFRIKEVNVDRDSGKVSASGVHVSYDLNGDLVDDIELGQVSAAMAIGRIYDNLMMEYRGMIATNLTDTSDGTFSGKFQKKNGMYCLTDPESGVVAAFGAKLTRDNWDLFVMEKTSTDRGYRIRYSKNANGIQWKEKTDKLITRVMPVAKNEDGSDLYLPEKWIDSAHISDYPVIYMETLKVDGQVGKDDGSGTDTVWTQSALLDEMRAKAGERFSVAKADVPVTEVTVQLQQLEKTAEFAWMKDLMKVLLYDTVTVSDPEIGKSETLTVTELEWDYILQKITGVKLSNVDTSITKSVTGYNVANGSIGREKLKDDVIEETISDAVYKAEEAATQRIPYNSKDQDGIVSKGSGNASKVWKTDANGNPAWRDEQSVSNFVQKTGDTMTGNLIVQHTSDDPPFVEVKDLTHILGLYLHIGASGGTQGLYSSGYYNPDTQQTTNTAKWLILRNKDGDVIVKGHAEDDLKAADVYDGLDSTSATKALSAKQGKALNDTTVKLTGNQTVGGAKTFTSAPVIKNSTTSPSIGFQGADLSAVGARMWASGCETSDGKYGRPRFMFYEYSPSSDGSSLTNYRDSYRLPQVASGKTQDDTYEILTTKENEIYDGLDSNSATRPLSANQGRVLGNHLVTLKEYSVSTTTNANVSPFGAYAEFDIPSADITAGGWIANVTVLTSASTNPAVADFNSTTSKIFVYSKTAASLTLRVTFVKTKD